MNITLTFSKFWKHKFQFVLLGFDVIDQRKVANNYEVEEKGAMVFKKSHQQKSKRVVCTYIYSASSNLVSVVHLSLFSFSLFLLWYPSTESTATIYIHFFTIWCCCSLKGSNFCGGTCGPSNTADSSRINM